MKNSFHKRSVFRGLDDGDGDGCSLPVKMEGGGCRARLSMLSKKGGWANPKQRSPTKAIERWEEVDALLVHSPSVHGRASRFSRRQGS